MQRWDTALDAFNTAIELRPSHPLARNARGVAHALREDWDDALTDLTRATQAAPELADAHANLGMFWMQQKTGAPGAVMAFSKALRHSPRLGIALYGRGCVESILCRVDESRKNLQAAIETAGCVNTIIGRSVLETTKRLEEKERLEVARAVPGENPGMEISRTLLNIQKHGLTPQNFTAFREFVHRHPDLARKAGQELAIIARQFPPEQSAHATNLVGIMDKRAFQKSGILKTFQGLEFGPQLEGQNGSIGANSNPVTGLSTQVLQNYTAERQAYEGFWQNFPHQYTPAGSYNDRLTPAGFKTDLAGACRDEGDWPFVVQYGLLYNTRHSGR
jgi:tetratricopeptide (TPR) repeat protein